MKKIIAFLITILIIGALPASAQIYKVERDDNYIVMTDTTNSRLEWQYPAFEIRFEEQGNSVKFFGENDRRVGSIAYNIDSLVNVADTAFSVVDSLRAYLRRNTGLSVE